MTIEPPVALHKPTVGSAEKMCPEGVAACPAYSFHMPTPPQTTGFSPGPETPDQYIPEGSFVVSSPSSALMYEQDIVSDMQKSLLSPCSHKAGLSDSAMRSPVLRRLVQDGMDDCHLHGEDFEQSFNLETMLNGSNSMPVKLEPTWGSALPIDTGQKFKVEDVMTSNNINQGPTLAQLNDIQDPFEDIDSIIRNDPINKPIPEAPNNPNAAVKIAPSSSSVTGLQKPKPASAAYSTLRTPGSVGSSVTMVTSTITPRLSLTINMPVKESRQTTCTITSPAQEVPRQMSCTITSPAQEVPSPSSGSPAKVPVTPNMQKTQTPVFNYLLTPSSAPLPTQPAAVMPSSIQSPGGAAAAGCPLFSLGSQLFVPGLSTVDQSSLNQLLHATIKSEPLSPGHTELSRPELHPSPGSSVVVPVGGGGGVKAEEPGRVLGLTGSPRAEGSDSNTSSTSLNQKWEEIRRYLETSEERGGSPQPAAKRGTRGASPEPTVKRMKVEADAAYQPGGEEEEGGDQEYNTDSDSDFDLSDTDSVGPASFVEELLVGGRREKRYFWQYNTQAKGPKGKRLCRSVDPCDPHVLNSFEDPVFDPEVHDARYKHTGRARKGDGNDVTPSPHKLYQIGNQLNRLNRKINEMAPPSELPPTTRNRTRREKNKYASRACRLKKKAQHEANKIKLYGLDTEHAQLMAVLDRIKSELVDRVTHGAYSQESMKERLEKLMQTHLTAMIAGNTSDYVNSVLERVIAGDKTGGIAKHKSRQ